MKIASYLAELDRWQRSTNKEASFIRTSGILVLTF